MALTRLPSFTLLNTDNFTFANVTVTGNVTSNNANLGNAATANYFIGNGSLLTGLPASYTDSNVAAYLPTFTGNIKSGNANLGNTVTANFFVGSGNNLSNIQGANVTGPVSYATTANSVAGANVTGAVSYATTANSVAGANVSGQVSNALVAGTVYTAAQPNITSVGTLTSLTVTGNITGNYIIGNGSQLTGLPASYTNSNVATYLPTYTGNLSPSNLVVSTSANLGLVSNVKITGGASGQLLQTDGAGNVSWVTPTGTTITVDNFTANGVQTAFTLSSTPASKLYTMVSMAGTMQPRSIYSVAGNVITFSSAPPNTAPIEVTTFSSIVGFGTGDITANSFTANSLTSNSFTSNTANANTITANILSGNIISSNSSLTVNTLTANSVINGGSGTPTLQSNTSIVLSAATVVRVSTSPMQFYTCTTTVRDTIAASNGYVIYNTTTNKLQVYANGAWADLN